jgi:hypothetical protein
MSTPQVEYVDINGIFSEAGDPDAGMCLNCGRKLTLCWIPFTLDVVCNKCNSINHFYNSKRPVRVTSMDSCVVT